MSEYRPASIFNDVRMQHVKAINNVGRSCFVILAMWKAIRSVLARISNLVGAAQASSRDADSCHFQLSIVGLIAGDQDRQLLSEVGARNGWKVFFADTCEDARVALDQFRAAVVVCDRDIPGKEWRDMIQVFRTSSYRVCIILLSKVVDANLWNEVLCSGGYDVLPKPLREKDLLRAIKLAAFTGKTPSKLAGNS